MSTPSEQHSSEQAFSPEADFEGDDEFAEIFAHLRATDEARARAGDVRGLWTTANSTISHLSSRYVTEPGVDFSEAWAPQLQNLWHLYYVAGRYCYEESVATLVLQIVETSSRGVLARTRYDRNGNPEVEHAAVVTTMGGQSARYYLWRDLPLLVPSMTSHWMGDCARMSRTQRVGVSFFLSSLAAASTSQWAFGLCGIALVLLRDALETDRRLVRAIVEPGGEDSENSGRSMGMLTIADLLPAVNAWLTRAGGRIAELCEAGHRSTTAREPACPMTEEVWEPGPLAKAAGVPTVDGGFSPQRWFFWLHRLDELGADAGRSPATGPASSFVQRVKTEQQLARQVAHNMLYVASQADSSIVRELGREHHHRHRHRTP
ncbi:hypothetical protein GGR56DRAFT_677122 [Xylariaceae sp. FL0804]|nr:hypothetical protein GGR56DRAFT_677122 [Xylariaceae sp. FL0804]